MFDFSRARLFMIEGQIRTNDITDPDIVGGMHSVPRERFVPESWQKMAYSDFEIPGAEDGQAGVERRMLRPMVLGKLLRAAAVQPAEFVLHIGCNTGYGAALLSRMANSVVAIEEEPLASKAAQNLSALGVGNVAVFAGELPKGHAAEAPYDVILIEGAVETIPDELMAQLKEGGRLVAINGAGRSGQGTVFRRTGKATSGFPMFDAAAPVLPGFEARVSFQF
jgi:protein-L-isoaspartate(D-aspartate) O-methyltransferase